MKFQAERFEGRNAITRHSAQGVVVGGMEYSRPLILGWQGQILEWSATSLESLRTEDAEELAALQPELVLFGSGARMRFARPAVWAPLMSRRIGVETMDTASACRTYNVLLAEDRAVVAALLFDSPGD